MSDEFRNVMDKIQDSEVQIRNASGKLSRKMRDGQLKEAVKNPYTREGMKHESYEGKTLRSLEESKAKVTDLGGNKL